jgi:hypothetical protein
VQPCVRRRVAAPRIDKADGIDHNYGNCYRPQDICDNRDEEGENQESDCGDGSEEDAAMKHGRQHALQRTQRPTPRISPRFPLDERFSLRECVSTRALRIVCAAKLRTAFSTELRTRV